MFLNYMVKIKICPEIFLAGWILIDRSGVHFGEILNFLRDGSVPLPETRKELLELLQEAKYYLVQDLVRVIEAALKQMDAAVDPICKVPLITSSREEQHLITNTQKVLICFVKCTKCTRVNN